MSHRKSRRQVSRKAVRQKPSRRKPPRLIEKVGLLALIASALFFACPQAIASLFQVRHNDSPTPNFFGQSPPSVFTSESNFDNRSGDRFVLGVTQNR